MECLGLWCVNVGYGREELAQAAYDQMKKMAYIPMTQSHEPAILLAEKLNEMLGGDYKIFYSNSGSDANEVAFKLARQYHQQNGEPSRYNSFPATVLITEAPWGHWLRRSSTAEI